jgi:hypothetical protein
VVRRAARWSAASRKGGNQTNEAQRTSAFLRGRLNATPGNNRDAHATLGTLVRIRHRGPLHEDSSAGMRSETALRRRRTAADTVEGDNSRVLPQVRGGVVGLAGLEPATSSLSGIEG